MVVIGSLVVVVVVIGSLGDDAGLNEAEQVELRHRFRLYVCVAVWLGYSTLRPGKMNTLGEMTK